MSTAILLIAHGSRNAEANDDLHHVAAELRRRGPYEIVEPAFLELAEPTIESGARRCVERGAGRVILLPCFLSPGVHVREDLCDHRERLAAQFPGVDFSVAEPVGRHPLLIDILAERAHEAARKPGNKH
jgi:sirohydrochlorin ferrochelatase